MSKAKQDELIEQIKDLKSKRSEHYDEISKLESERDKLREDLEEAQEWLQDEKDELQGLYDKADQKNKEVDWKQELILQGYVSNAEEDIEMTEGCLKENKKNREALWKKCILLSDQIKDLKKELKALEAQAEQTRLNEQQPSPVTQGSEQQEVIYTSKVPETQAKKPKRDIQEDLRSITQDYEAQCNRSFLKDGGFVFKSSAAAIDFFKNQKEEKSRAFDVQCTEENLRIYSDGDVFVQGSIQQVADFIKDRKMYTIEPDGTLNKRANPSSDQTLMEDHDNTRTPLLNR